LVSPGGDRTLDLKSRGKLFDAHGRCYGWT
jgi:hypothetical protein